MLFIVLVVLLAASVEGQLEFTSTQLTHSVSIKCVLKDFQSSDITLLLSMIVSRVTLSGEDILASVTTVSSRPFNHSGVINSSISIDGSHESFVNIEWFAVNNTLEGNYVCRAYGLDVNNMPLTLSQTLNLDLEDPGPVVKVTPATLEAGFTKSLQVKCYILDLVSISVSQLTTIGLSHAHNGIDQMLASISVFEGLEVKPGSDIETSNGHLGQNDNLENFLEVSWSDPDLNRTGTYQCLFNGLDINNVPVQYESKFELKPVDPSKETLIQLLKELQNKYDLSSQENKELASERDSLKRQISVLEESLEGHAICDDVDLPTGHYGITLFPDDGQGLLNVICHVAGPGDVWTVFQRRYNGEVDFNRGFAEYDKGFGSVQGEHWLGLSVIKRIMKTGSYQLRVDIIDHNDVNYTRVYPQFGIGASDGYQLTVEGYNDGGHGMSYMSGASFSTFDHGSQQHCAIQDFSGWWFDNCAFTNLNGQWGHAGESGVSWFEIPDGRSHPLKFTEMKFKKFSNP